MTESHVKRLIFGVYFLKKSCCCKIPSSQILDLHFFQFHWISRKILGFQRTTQPFSTTWKYSCVVFQIHYVFVKMTSCSQIEVRKYKTKWLCCSWVKTTFKLFFGNATKMIVNRDNLLHNLACFLSAILYVLSCCRNAKYNKCASKYRKNIDCIEIDLKGFSYYLCYRPITRFLRSWPISKL